MSGGATALLLPTPPSHCPVTHESWALHSLPAVLLGCDAHVLRFWTEMNSHHFMMPDQWAALSAFF
jgi:hypothetical protein